MLPERKDDSYNLFTLSFIFASITSLITAILVLFFFEPLSNLFHIQQLANISWILSSFIFLSSAYNILNLWNTRSKKYGRLSIVRIFTSVITLVAQLIIGFLGILNDKGLIISAFIGQFIATFSLGALIFSEEAKSLKQEVTWIKLSQMLGRYKKFPIYSTPSSLLNIISWQIPSFFLSFFFSTTVAGFYDLGN